MTLEGFAAPEVERAYARARALCERAGDTPQLFPALWGLWLFSWGQGDVPQARRIADDLLARAERIDDRGVRLEAHHALWATLFSQGELAAACDHAARGYALYDPEAHGALATVYGNHDAGACSRLFGGWALGLLGFPERAVESLHEAIALGERSQQPFDLAWAHFYLAAVHQCQGERAAARARAEAALAMAREHAFGLISAWAAALRGWAIAAEGQPDAGISGLRDGLAAAQATGSKRFDSYFLGLLGEACLLAGRASEGLTAVAEGLATVAMTGERFYEAELWRLRGELLRAEDDPAPPEECFLRAREIARGQGSRWLELRAAMSLSRLRRLRGRTEAAREMLAGVYGGFAEGLETADLREARALLQA